MSTLNLPINLPSSKRPRRAILSSQRRALRVWWFTEANQAVIGRNRLEACGHWWQEQYGYTLSTSSASEILGPK